MKFTYEFDLNDEQVEELRMLKDAMNKSSKYNYDLESTFEFVMLLGSIHRINDAIESAAYHYDKYYDNYPYRFGITRTREIFAKEEELGVKLSTEYPNPTIDRREKWEKI